MKRLFRYITGQISKIQAKNWLVKISEELSVEKLDLIIEQDNHIIISSSFGQIKYLYNKSPKLSYYAPNYIITPAIPDNTYESYETSLFSNMIALTYDQLIQSCIIKLKQDIPTQTLSKHSDEQQLKAMEWLRVSIQVLTKAIDHCQDNKELIYKGFLYTYKKEESFHVHINAMSLSFMIIFRSDGVMQVSVWNNKDREPDFKRTPDMSTDYIGFKNQVFDLLIPLIVKISRISTQGL